MLRSAARRWFVEAKAAAEICDVFIDARLLPGSTIVLEDFAKNSEYPFIVGCAAAEPQRWILDVFN